MFHKPVKAKKERKQISEALSQHQKSFQLGSFGTTNLAGFTQASVNWSTPGNPSFTYQRIFMQRLLSAKPRVR